MNSHFKAAGRAVCVAIGLHGVPTSAAAQAPHVAPPSTSEPKAAHPADAKAPVPAALYRSPFTGYQAYTDAPVAPWRDSNETVRERGGWRAYARESAEPAAAAPAAKGAASAPPAAPAGHSGHRMK